MATFTQKWTIVALLEPMHERQEYAWTDWPVHVTLADVFAVDWKKDDLLNKFLHLLESQKPFTVPAEEEAHWGKNGSTLVMKLAKTPEIMRLHADLLQLLKDSGVNFNNPEHTGEGFVPHSTVQKSGRLQPGDTVPIDTIALIDMFPDGDGYKRRITQLIRLTY